MTDCVFEKINDIETLTTLSDKVSIFYYYYLQCGEVVDLLHSVQDTKEDIIQVLFKFLSLLIESREFGKDISTIYFKTMECITMYFTN